MKYLILAGGFATRLWPLTESRAKPLLLLNGKTILAHIISKIEKKSEIIILTNKAFLDDFEAEVGKFRGDYDIKIFEEDAESDGEKVGALKAVSLAIEHYKIKEDIFILAGDNLLPELDLNFLKGESSESVLAVQEVEDLYEARKFGVVEVEEIKPNSLHPSLDSSEGDKRKVIAFEEKPEKPKSKLVSTGFMFIGEKLFKDLHDFANIEPDALGGIFPYFLEQGKIVKSYLVEGDWFDVGSFETYLDAHQKLQKEKLVKGKKVVDKNNKFRGKVFLADGVELENCTIIDSIIYPGTKLKNCQIARCIIDKNCDLKGLGLSQKLIRQNTKLSGE